MSDKGQSVWVCCQILHSAEALKWVLSVTQWEASVSSALLSHKTQSWMNDFAERIKNWLTEFINWCTVWLWHLILNEQSWWFLSHLLSESSELEKHLIRNWHYNAEHCRTEEQRWCQKFLQRHRHIFKSAMIVNSDVSTECMHTERSMHDEHKERIHMRAYRKVRGKVTSADQEKILSVNI